MVTFVSSANIPVNKLLLKESRKHIIALFHYLLEDWWGKIHGRVFKTGICVCLLVCVGEKMCKWHKNIMLIKTDFKIKDKYKYIEIKQINNKVTKFTLVEPVHLLSPTPSCSPTTARSTN